MSHLFKWIASGIWKFDILFAERCSHTYTNIYIYLHMPRMHGGYSVEHKNLEFVQWNAM